MTQELPTTLDIRRLLERTEPVAGIVSIGRLGRIKQPFEAVADVLVTARVNGDNASPPRLTGQLRTQVGATCQRCLEQMVFDIEKRFDVRLIDAADDKAEQDLDDVAELHEEILNIEQFIEDEVMLACPMIPLHDDENCGASDSSSSQLADERRRPFTGLAELLGSTKDKPGE
jgi:uncharacterized protein